MANIKLSQTAANIEQELEKHLDLDRPSVARIAFAKGLKHGYDPNAVFRSDSNVEIPVETIVHPDEQTLFRALISEKLGKRVTVVELPPLVKHFVEVGFARMKEEYGSMGRPDLDYLIRLATSSGTTSMPRVPAVDLVLGIGTDGKDIVVPWNRHEHNQHFAVVGTTGAGKTQFVLDLLTQIRAASPGTGVIFIDYAKGDVAENALFTQALQAEVVDVRTRPAPVNPLRLGGAVDDRRHLIEGFVELVDSIERIGTVQRNRLVKILNDAYSQTEQPDFYLLAKIQEDVYERENIRPDTLSEVLRQLTYLRLFPDQSDPVYAPLYNHVIVFDVHRLQALKELTAFFILYTIYNELRQMPDSAVVDGRREMRCVVVIDEAHNYLTARNKVLEGMLRELRSKGVSIILMSQGIEDFEQRDFDYADLMNWRFVMRTSCNAPELMRFLGIRHEVARELAPRLAHLPGGRAFFMNEGKLVEMQARQFYARGS